MIKKYYPELGSEFEKAFDEFRNVRLSRLKDNHVLISIRNSGGMYMFKHYFKILDRKHKFFESTLSYEGLLPNSPINNKKDRYLNFLISWSFLFPPRYRELFEGDLHETHHELWKKGHRSLYIYWCLFLETTSALYAAFRFKYEEYFGSDKAKGKNK